MGISPQVNNTNPDNPWVSNVCSFTTAKFLIVDNFEDYIFDII